MTKRMGDVRVRTLSVQQPDQQAPGCKPRAGTTGFAGKRKETT